MIQDTPSLSTNSGGAVRGEAGQWSSDCPARVLLKGLYALGVIMQALRLPLKSGFWCIALCLSFIQAACTPDSSSLSVSSTANESSSASSSDASVSDPRSETSAPNDRLETNGKRPEFALIIGETNDDGLQEEISACEFNKICVTTLETKSKRVYQNSAWQSVSLIALQDTDGDPGSEIVLLAYTREGLLACVCVIHDKTTSIEFYGGLGWGSVEVKTLANTDAIDGDEIIVHVKTEEGTLRCLCIIRDRDRTVREYGDESWTTIHIKEVVDTDGESGKEVIFESRDATDQLVCVCILRDRQHEIGTYADSRWRMGEVKLFVDTDGQPGLEIVVAFMNASDSGITIIHDISRTSKTYLFEGGHTIQQVRNFDRSQGEEICVLLLSREEFVLISDRVQEQEVVESCGEKSTGRT